MVIQCKLCGELSKFLCEISSKHPKINPLKCYKCISCGSVFIGNNISNEELETAYSLLDNDTYYEEIKYESSLKMKFAINTFNKWFPKTIKIIDIGTGNGSFVKMLLGEGFIDVSAYEIPGTDLSEIKELRCKVYFGFDYNKIPNNMFDLVTLLDVAEHVIDPIYLFSSCHRILKRGGTIYFHTPIVARLDRIMQYFLRFPGIAKIGEIWQTGRTNIFHLQNYTTKSLNIILSNCGYEKITITTKNELSWPIEKYVRHHLCERLGLPFLSRFIAPFFYPFLKNTFLNANKVIIMAQKPE